MDRPSNTRRRGPLRRFAAFVEAQLQWIDDNSEVPEGRLSPNARVTVVFAVAAFSLAMISYTVLNGPTQRGIAEALLAGLRQIDPTLWADLKPYHPLARNIVWSLGCMCFYLILPALVVRLVFGQRLSDYGLSLRGFFRHLGVYVVLFIPVGLLVLAVANEPDFQRQYPFYKKPVGVADFVVWECFYALQFFSLEFFFRGFLLHGTKDKLGRFAIFVAVVPYTMIHFRKPFFETLGAVLAGSVLGTLSLRTVSIVGGFLIHVAVAISMDVAAMAMRGG